MVSRRRGFIYFSRRPVPFANERRVEVPLRRAATSRAPLVTTPFGDVACGPACGTSKAAGPFSFLAGSLGGKAASIPPVGRVAVANGPRHR